MTEAERFLVDVERIAVEALELVRIKNQDYGNPDDPFANFKDVLEDGISVERGIVVRMRDKLRRLSNLLDRDPAVVDESVIDTCKDLSNYALILATWRRWEGKE